MSEGDVGLGEEDTNTVDRHTLTSVFGIQLIM